MQGLVGVGATFEEASSGLMAVSVLMGVGGIILSLANRMPISVAWSTAGAAFLASLAVPEGGFAEAVGAFIICGIMVILAGLWKPLGRAVESIPLPLASAMLAGVLLPICLAPFIAIGQYPLIALPIFLTWVAVGYFNKFLAVPIAVVVAVILIMLNFDGNVSSQNMQWAGAVFVKPIFTFEAVGIALPLFVITMASQNITGLSVLRSYNYHPDSNKLFSCTGILSVIGAFFGSHAINLAAITAAMCAGEDCHPDPKRRYWSSIIGGIVYIFLGLTAGYAVSFISVSPPILITAVAGLALLTALGTALITAMENKANQKATIITFLITASGVSFFGISGAFWGLLAGGAMYYLNQWRTT